MVRFTHPTYRFIVFTPSLPNGKVKAMRILDAVARTEFWRLLPCRSSHWLGAVVHRRKKRRASPRGIPTRLHRLPRRSARRNRAVGAQHGTNGHARGRRKTGSRPIIGQGAAAGRGRNEGARRNPVEASRAWPAAGRRLQETPTFATARPRSGSIRRTGTSCCSARRASRDTRWSSSPPTPAGPTRRWSRSTWRPRLIHAGLLATGAKPGHPARFQPEFTPPTGTEIAIELRWKRCEGQGAFRPCRRLDPRHQDEEAD